jgi:beta-lactam-binding protein with PASTA domain
LILSAGPTAVTTTTTPTNSTLRTLPNLVGESRATVYATMRQLGLYFVTSGPGSNNASWTKVVSQRPGANAQVKYHSTVYLKVTK